MAQKYDAKTHDFTYETDPPMVELSQEDLGLLLIGAIRYAQGRMTYIVSSTIALALRHIKQVSDYDLSIMIEDCDFQRRMALYGDERIDKPNWLAYREALLQEKERRCKHDSN